MTATTCLEGGTRHSWSVTGLDVQDDQLVSTRRCVWCQLRQIRPYRNIRAAWRGERSNHA